MLKFASNALAVLGYFAAAGIALIPTGFLLGRVLPVVDLFAQFLFGGIIASFLVCIGALLIRRVRLATVAGALLLLCVGLILPYEMAPRQTASDRQLRLLSFNIFFDNAHLDEVVTRVRAINADVVFLLEVERKNRDGLRGLDQDYPYRIECWQKRRCDILVLSRVPLKDLEPRLTIINTPPAWAAAEIEFKGCRFSLVAAHLSLPFPFHYPGEQGARAESLTQIVQQIKEPKILAGDFNAATWGAIIADIAEQTHLNVLTGYGATWPTTFPTYLGIPIDNILASHDFTFLSRELEAIPGSDHRGVLTEIALPPEGQCDN
jgi:endonuclease/exonuclease/phosphatase (EEP) superfamily protein YafD